MNPKNSSLLPRPEGWVNSVIAFCLQNRLVVFLGVAGFLAWGVLTAPFDWKLGDLPRDPVPVDAIPDIGENQQIVFTEWPGRSPQDVEDQLTYPLTSALLGVPGVKSIRSFSMFGFASIYVIFEESADFYRSRTRILEKLSALSPGTLPADVRPVLGPDATPLGQVFWYTLEGRDSDGRSTGGWDPQELRSVQDWIVRYELTAVPGVAEVASIGGFVKEYQVDVDPDAMRAHGVSLQDVVRAVQSSNLDIGARTLEINRVEYVIRGLGFVKRLEDLEEAVVKERENVPLRVRDVARVSLGPATRRGALDKGGAEAVGGVVVVRYGANPLAVIQRVKDKIRAFSPSLPEKTIAMRTPDGREAKVLSRVAVVPFYDRTGLIYETLGTLNRALAQEILVTVIVVIVMLLHLRSSILVSGLLPLAVLLCFVAMRLFRVDANVVALSGIAIAIGTMVDMGIVMSENILRRLERDGPDEPLLRVVYNASAEVGSAVLTAVSTTVVSFLPVFTMQAAEGKLFKPLAYTKTFALVASLLVALTVIPPAAYTLFGRRRARGGARAGWAVLLWIGAVVVFRLTGSRLAPAVLFAWGLYLLVTPVLPEAYRRALEKGANAFAVAVMAYVLTKSWMPLGIGLGLRRNLLFVGGMIGGLLFLVYLFQRAYPAMLRWCLA
ncbi:MAG: efflux RND transporter permease subunit, partial [Planctomycetota bacterium]